MKKLIVFIAAFCFNAFIACQSNDQKEESATPYPTYDTTRLMEKINTPNTDSIKSVGSSNGELH